MKLLVTGAYGQLARSLAERANKDDALYFAARPKFDMKRPHDLTAIMDAFQPNAVVNAAAFTAVDDAEDNPAEAFAINADAPRIIAEIAAARSIPLVHISTDYVFDGQSGAPYREDTPTAPRNVYGASKLAGEVAVSLADADHLIVRTAWVYSRFGRNFMATMLRLAESHDQIDVVADQIGNPTSALDLADGLLAALAQRRRMGRFPVALAHLAGTGSTSWRDFARHILITSAEAGGPTAAVRAISTAEYPTRAPRPADSRLDSTLFTSTFGYRAPDWRISTAVAVRDLIASKKLTE